MFTAVPYMGPAPRGRWPVPSSDFSGEVAERSMHLSLEQFELADQLGFDWVTVAEHHFAPMSLTPNPIYMAGSSPESGEFAARNHLSLGLAFTTVPLASKAARYGWTRPPMTCYIG